MSATARRTLDGWEVRVDLDFELDAGDPDPAGWLSPAAARALAAELVAAAGAADTQAAAEAALPLRDRVLATLQCARCHTTDGLSLLIGEPKAAVRAALDELCRAGAVSLWRGMADFWVVGGSR